MLTMYNIHAMNFTDFQALTKMVREEKSRRVKEIESIYGTVLCKHIDAEKIYNLPEFSAEDLTLTNDDAYPACGRVRAAMLKGFPAVRGVMGSGRAFLALRIEILDPQTKKRLDEVVELVFQRYSEFKDNYVAIDTIGEENGEKYFSFLYSGGGMGNKQMIAIKELLEGKEILDPVNSSELIRLVHS